MPSLKNLVINFRSPRLSHIILADMALGRVELIGQRHLPSVE